MASKWLERYTYASFRNLHFFIKAHTVTGGRRLAAHTFPSNDNTFYEDMGKKSPKFTLDAYVTGDDYFKLRNDFEEALNKKGNGVLVHPYRGTLDVHVEEFTLSENTDEGRVARFSISFVLAEPETLTLETLYTDDAVLVSKSSLLDSIHNWCASVYRATSLAVNKLNALVGALDAITQVMEDAKLLMQPYAEFQAIMSNIEGKLIAIALDAEDLFNTFKDIIDFGTDTNQDVQPTSANALPQFQSLLASLSQTSTPATGLEQEDQMILLQNKLVVASCASLLLVAEFTSADEAQDSLDALFTVLDTIVENQTTTDEEYMAFTELKAVLYGNISQKALQLSKLKTIELDETKPSLVITNSLYGNLDGEESLLARNKIMHPAFISGGVPLKVLTDV